MEATTEGGTCAGARAGVRESVQPCSNLSHAAERAPVPASECGRDQVSADFGFRLSDTHDERAGLVLPLAGTVTATRLLGFS